MLVTDLLSRSALLYPDVEAVSDGAQRRTFRELARRCAQLAAGLQQLGVAPGERVAVVARNRVEYVELYFAVTALGAVIVPVHWRLHANEIAFVVDDSESVVVIAEDRFVAAMAANRERCARVRDWISLGTASASWIDFESLASAAAEPHEVRIDERDSVVQMYTSGTTGTPKGALLSHRNITAMVVAWLREIRLRPVTSRFLQVTPLFHVGGMLQVMSTIAAGAQLRLEAEFLPGPVLDVLERERVTHALFVPAMIQWLLAEKDVESRRLSGLELLIYGAAPMPVPLLERAMSVFRCAFLQGYGLTETCGVLTTLRPEDHDFDDNLERLSSAGRAVPGCEVRVVDEHGRDVELDGVGEIIARGDNVFAGYWKRDDATRECLRDGWFRTGDLARIDRDGYVWVVDRLKDMLLVGGENVYPREVELALLTHPAVADTAVIGIPHEAWGEEVLALVALRPNTNATERELIQHCRTTLARFKCPTRVELRDAIPRNAAGKVLKHELREPYWQGRERRV